MQNPQQFDEAFRQFSENLKQWVPDGVITVELKLLNEIGLLNLAELDMNLEELTANFHVIETQEKITLYNQQFVIWIVPKSDERGTSTLIYLAMILQEQPHLELVFSTSGVYNTPRYILKVLQHFLKEVIDTEAVISSIGKKT